MKFGNRSLEWTNLGAIDFRAFAACPVWVDFVAEVGSGGWVDGHLVSVDGL
jgi:hypothetical protein